MGLLSHVSRLQASLKNGAFSFSTPTWGEFYEIFAGPPEAQLSPWGNTFEQKKHDWNFVLSFLAFRDSFSEKS